MTRDTGATGGPDDRGDLDPGPGQGARQGATQAARVATYRVHFRRGEKGRRRLRDGERPAPPETKEAVPRIAKLMALAIHFDRLVREGVVEDYADIARLGGVSRARVSQIMDLLNLAPDIQEEILFCKSTSTGTTERSLRPASKCQDWSQQWEHSHRLLAAHETL